MIGKTKQRFWLFTLLTIVLSLFAVEASAQTVFIPVNFGATFEPQQINDMVFSTGSEDARLQLVSRDERDAQLGTHFPELTLPNVSDLEQLFANGNEAYFDGDYEASVRFLREGLNQASDRLVGLSLRPGFAETTYQGGLYLAQMLLNVQEKEDEAAVVVETLIRLFPTQSPNAEMFPPQFLELYQSYLPSAANGNELTVRVGEGCYARINGKDLAGGAESKVIVLKGEYGIVEVCDEQTTRAYVLPVNGPTVVDFRGVFAKAYTYPISLTLDAKDHMESDETMGDLLGTIGERIGAAHVIGGGLVPEGGTATPGYRMVLVDVKSKSVTRAFTVPPSELASKEGMADALNALWTGAEFEVISLEPEGGISLATISYITMGTGVVVLSTAAVLGVLAKQANDDFYTCNDDEACRQTDKRSEYIRTRWRYSLVADILYGAGGAIAAAGLGMLIYDLASGPDSDMADSGWDFGIATGPESGSVQLLYRW